MLGTLARTSLLRSAAFTVSDKPNHRAPKARQLKTRKDNQK